MDVVWYPGSGDDFNPLATDLFTRVVGPSSPSDLLLWMTDYSPDVIDFFANLGHGDDLPCGFGAAELRCVGLTRRLLDGAELARAESQERWDDNWKPPTRPPVDWDVAEIEVESRTGDRWLPIGCRVRFSPFESQAMIEHVLAAERIRVRSLILIRMGGFALQRRIPDHTGLSLDHHGRRFFDLVNHYASQSGTGLPDFVATEWEVGNSVWTDPNSYELTEIAYERWVDRPVRLFRRRQGFTGSGIPPAFNPRSRFYQRP